MAKAGRKCQVVFTVGFCLHWKFPKTLQLRMLYRYLASVSPEGRDDSNSLVFKFGAIVCELQAFHSIREDDIAPQPHCHNHKKWDRPIRHNSPSRHY